MKHSYTKDQINKCYSYYLSGKPVSIITKEFNISRSTLYYWFNKINLKNKNHDEFTIKNFKTLKDKVNRLQTIIEIINITNCTVNSPLKDKLDAIEKLFSKYSVRILCEALNVPRGTFYNHILRNKRANTWYAKRKEELRTQIEQIYNDNHQIFGAQKITAILKENGIRTSIKMVAQLMRDMGLKSIRDYTKLNYDKEQKQYKNYLNQQFTTTSPNEVWVSDITYFKIKNHSYYICAIIDLFSRKVIACKIGLKNSTQLVKKTFKVAYETRNPVKPLIFHTDRGSNYRSKSFCTYLKSLNVTQSYSRAYVPYDNSVMESFFASLKKEELYRTNYRSENEFRTAVNNYIKFYNEIRPHGNNAFKTPDKNETEYFSNNLNKN